MWICFVKLLVRDTGMSRLALGAFWARKEENYALASHSGNFLQVVRMSLCLGLSDQWIDSNSRELETNSFWIVAEYSYTGVGKGSARLRQFCSCSYLPLMPGFASKILTLWGWDSCRSRVGGCKKYPPAFVVPQYWGSKVDQHLILPSPQGETDQTMSECSKRTKEWEWEAGSAPARLIMLIRNLGQTLLASPVCKLKDRIVNGCMIYPPTFVLPQFWWSKVEQQCCISLPVITSRRKRSDDVQMQQTDRGTAAGSAQARPIMPIRNLGHTLLATPVGEPKDRFENGCRI